MLTTTPNNKNHFFSFSSMSEMTHIFTQLNIFTHSLLTLHKDISLPTWQIFLYPTTQQMKEMNLVVRVSHDTKTFSSITYALIIINLMYEKYSCYQIIMRITSNACTTIGIQISYTLIIWFSKALIYCTWHTGFL